MPPTFEISKVQPKVLTMGQNPLDGVFQQIKRGENNRANDYGRFSEMTKKLTNLLDSAEREIRKIRKEHSIFQSEIDDSISEVHQKIDSLEIPKSLENEIKELTGKIDGISDEIKTIKETGKKEGVAGGVGSQIIVRRNLGKLFKKETPRGDIDGSNKDFYLTRPPFGGFMILELNGQGLSGGGEDYTLAGNHIAYNIAPPVGSKHYGVFF